ncbi:MAG TPA: signal peptidase II [Bacteroidota bacterium]|nr:signal peptidase II [Bacteroidota bacterium]
MRQMQDETRERIKGELPLQVLYVTLGIVLLDQATKLLIKGFTIPWTHYYHAGMQMGQTIPVIGNFLRLTYVENPGMAFGIDIGGRVFLALFSLAASVGIFYYLFKIRREALSIRLSLALILGGAVGNLIDRIFYGVIFGEGPLFHGKVVDFIDMDFFKIHFMNFSMDRFAVFNVADSAVTVGIVLMLLFHKQFSELEKNSEPLPAAEEPPAANSESGETPASLS